LACKVFKLHADNINIKSEVDILIQNMDDEMLRTANFERVCCPFFERRAELWQ
jgi:hypothetical protein